MQAVCLSTPQVEAKHGATGGGCLRPRTAAVLSEGADELLVHELVDA